MRCETEFLRSQIKESFAWCNMNDSNQCPLCGLRTASERSTLTHLRSDHKRKESEIADLLSREKAGSLGCDPAAKLLNKVIHPSPAPVNQNLSRSSFEEVVLRESPFQTEVFGQDVAARRHSDRVRRLESLTTQDRRQSTCDT